VVQGCPPPVITASAHGTWMIPRGATCAPVKFAGATQPDLTKRVAIVGEGSGDERGAIRAAGGHGVEFGGYAAGLPANTTRTANVLLRNFRVIGNGSTSVWGVIAKGDMTNVEIDGLEITGFDLGIHLQGTAATSGFSIRGSNIHHNRGMGLLGTAPGLDLSGNTFAFNNASGSTFNHGVYLGSSSYVSRGVRVVGNTFLDNSIAPSGQCTGGNFTVHGQYEGLLVEGNTVTQTRGATGGCYGMSITPAYASAEWFRGLIVRGNTIRGTGGHAIAVASAIGAVIENNRAFNAGSIGQGIPPGAGDDQDQADDTKVIRNNCGASVAIRGQQAGNTAACQ
jgi:hypothetical protein